MSSIKTKLWRYFCNRWNGFKRFIKEPLFFNSLTVSIFAIIILCLMWGLWSRILGVADNNGLFGFGWILPKAKYSENNNAQHGRVVSAAATVAVTSAVSVIGGSVLLTIGYRKQMNAENHERRMVEIDKNQEFRDVENEYSRYISMFGEDSLAKNFDAIQGLLYIAEKYKDLDKNTNVDRYIERKQRTIDIFCLFFFMASRFYNRDLGAHTQKIIWTELKRKLCIHGSGEETLWADCKADLRGVKWRIPISEEERKDIAASTNIKIDNIKEL